MEYIGQLILIMSMAFVIAVIFGSDKWDYLGFPGMILAILTIGAVNA
ncbi:MAG: hypothetical protein OXI33_02815 [Chloroflexota bacterium]|nr:hypothetical protein [Chloroflexota bacterium]